MTADPTQTDPDKYKVLFENHRVRVLEYRDRPGDRTSPHRHPDSVMYTLSSFERRLIHGDRQRDVRIEAGRVNWVAAQEHSGENFGATESHAIFVEPRSRRSRRTPRRTWIPAPADSGTRRPSGPRLPRRRRRDVCPGSPSRPSPAFRPASGAPGARRGASPAR